MNTHNGKSLFTALILSLAALSVQAAESPRIVDLPTITVRPDAAQRAEPAIAPTRIVDLPAVSVRPSAAQRAELAGQATAIRTVDLPVITVRPTAA